MGEWEKKYKIRIVIEQIEMKRHSKEVRNFPVIKHKYVTMNGDEKECFYGPDRSMLLAYGFLFDKLQGFNK